MGKNYKATFRIKKNEWKNFKKVCDTSGLDASTVLRLFIKKINEDKDIKFLLP